MYRRHPELDWLAYEEAIYRRLPDLTRERPAALHEPSELLGVAAAIGGLPWVLRNRRVVPADVQRALLLLDRDDAAVGGTASGASHRDDSVSWPRRPGVGDLAHPL